MNKIQRKMEETSEYLKINEYRKKNRIDDNTAIWIWKYE